ncbi:MAG: iron transporter substrate-binding protein [Firmicutes bacterium]|nr:iron transporter substrate-binding protein [Bacillota bacterium]
MRIKKMVGISILLLIGAVIWLFFRNDTVQSTETENDKRVVTDSIQRNVEIPKHPKRVLFLNASNLDLFCAAGGAELVVGKPTSQALSEEVKKLTADVPEIGIIHTPNIEKILSLKPDLVIGANVPYHHALIPVLEQAGIPLLVRSLDTYEQVLETMTFYGELTGKEKATKERITMVEKDYQQAVAQSNNKKAPKNLIIFGSPESFSMGTQKSFVGDLIARLGGNNIADQIENSTKDAFVPLSMEFVAKQNPSVIFLIMHGTDGENAEKKVQQDLSENPAWADVEAVKNKRVYVLPYALFAVNPGTQVAEAIRVLSDHLYREENAK